MVFTKTYRTDSALLRRRYITRDLCNPARRFIIDTLRAPAKLLRYYRRRIPPGNLSDYAINSLAYETADTVDGVYALVNTAIIKLVRLTSPLILLER